MPPWPHAWAGRLNRARRSKPAFAPICLITGYNPTTGEIATSDSWGEGFEERWMTEAEAEAIGTQYLTAITW